MDNSIKKGLKLEDKVFDLLSELLKEDTLFVSNKTSRIFKRKGYFSNKREKNIIFDVTIETKMPNVNQYSLLTVFECKNLNRKVTVDDVEEFGSKLNQIGEHNTKGILLSTQSFQSSAIKIARKEGIGLARLSPENEIQWENYRKSSKLNYEIDAEAALTNDSQTITPFICLLGEKTILNFTELLLDLTIFDKIKINEKIIDIPFVPIERIDFIVEKLYTYDITDNQILNFEKLTALMELKYNVNFEYDTNENYLGKIEFNPLVIKISKNARIDENLWRFTLAHEIGHLILHSKLLVKHLTEKKDDEYSLAMKTFSKDKQIDRLEFQANLFASHVLLPEKTLRSIMNHIFLEYRIHKKQLYLDHQPVNKKEVYEILYRLSDLFKVSVETIKIRLIQLKLMVDKTDTRIGTILRNHFK